MLLLYSLFLLLLFYCKTHCFCCCYIHCSYYCYPRRLCISYMFIGQERNLWTRYLSLITTLVIHFVCQLPSRMSTSIPLRQQLQICIATCKAAHCHMLLSLSFASVGEVWSLGFNGENEVDQRGEHVFIQLLIHMYDYNKRSYRVTIDVFL